MNRRDALTTTAVLLGGTIIGAQAFLSACKAIETESGTLFSDADLVLLDEIGETILPATPKSPGAKAAKVAAFMAVIVADCYDEKEQVIFLRGLKILKDLSVRQYGQDFIELSSDEKTAFLTALDKEAKVYSETKKEEAPEHYFSMMKQLTLWGYFSSEPGMTEALRFVPVPGRYEGCIDYQKGDGAWA